MENLRRRGLVEYHPAGAYWHKVYRLTEEGKALEATWTEKIVDEDD